MTDLAQPQVLASAEVRVVKQPSRQTWGHFSREQAQMVIDAASLVGAHCARDFASAMLAAINCATSDADVSFAIRVILQEYNSEDLIDQIFAKNTGANRQ